MLKVLSKTSSNKPGNYSVSKKKSGLLLKECAKKILLNPYAANMAWWYKDFMEAWKTFKWILTEVDNIRLGNDYLKKHWPICICTMNC